MPVPVVPKVGPLSAVYSDGTMSMHYPKDWKMKQVSTTGAVIYPEKGSLGMVNGHGPYYSHGIFVGTYRPYNEEVTSFSSANDRYLAGLLQNNPGSRIANHEPLKFEVSAHPAITTFIINLASPIGEEHLYSVSIDAGSSFCYVTFIIPVQDMPEYAEIIADIVGSISITAHNEK